MDGALQWALRFTNGLTEGWGEVLKRLGLAFTGVGVLLVAFAPMAAAEDQHNSVFPTVSCGGEWHWVHNQTTGQTATITIPFASGTVQVTSNEFTQSTIHYRYQATQGETLLPPGASDNITGGKLVLSDWPDCPPPTTSTSTTTTTEPPTTTSTSTTTTTQPATTSTTQPATTATVLATTVTTDPGVLPVTGLDDTEILAAVGLLSLLLGITLVAESRRRTDERLQPTVIDSHPGDPWHPDWTPPARA